MYKCTWICIRINAQLFLKSVFKSCVLWSPHTVTFHMKASLLCPAVTHCVSRADPGRCALPQLGWAWPTHSTAFCGFGTMAHGGTSSYVPWLWSPAFCGPLNSGISLDTLSNEVSQNNHGHLTAIFWTWRTHESKIIALWGSYRYCVVWHLDFIIKSKVFAMTRNKTKNSLPVQIWHFFVQREFWSESCF